jgi:hypothetical protein
MQTTIPETRKTLARIVLCIIDIHIKFIDIHMVDVKKTTPKPLLFRVKTRRK